MSRLQDMVFLLCVRVCIARAYYPSDCVFLLSHLSHEGEKGMEKGKNGGAEDRKNACFRSSQRAKQRLWQRLSVKSYQTPDATAWNTVNYIELWQMWQQKAYNSCPYTRARARERGDYRIFYTSNIMVFRVYFSVIGRKDETHLARCKNKGLFWKKHGDFSRKVGLIFEVLGLDFETLRDNFENPFGECSEMSFVGSNSEPCHSACLRLGNETCPRKAFDHQESSKHEPNIEHEC